MAKQGRAQGSESSLTRNCCACIKSQTKLKTKHIFPILITCITLLKDPNRLPEQLVPRCVSGFSGKGWKLEGDQNPYWMFPQRPFKNPQIYTMWFKLVPVYRRSHNQGLPLQADCQQQATQSLTDNMLSRNASFVIADVQNYFPWKPKIWRSKLISSPLPF